MAKMSESGTFFSGTAVSTEPNRVIANLVQQDHHSNSVTTVSGDTRPAASTNSSVTSTPMQANGIRGNLLPDSSGVVTPILSQEGLFALLQSYITRPEETVRLVRPEPDQ